MSDGGKMSFLPIVFLALIALPPAKAVEIRVRQSDSPDKHYRCFLVNEPGKLRFQVVSQANGKVLGEFPSVYEPLQGKSLKTTAPAEIDAGHLAYGVGVNWSPDSRYVLLDEANGDVGGSEIGHEFILAEVTPARAVRLPLPMERMKAFTRDKRDFWTMQFGQWLGNRMFFGTLYGETISRGEAPSQSTGLTLVFRIGSDGAVRVENADE